MSVIFVNKGFCLEIDCGNMDGFSAYKTYLALKSHFSNSYYDYFKYNGRSRASLKSFEQRHDKYFFTKLANHKDIINFLVANFLHNGTSWVGDLVNEESAEKNYREWKKRVESLSYIFRNDIDRLGNCYNGNLKVVDGGHPVLLVKHLRKEIAPETILILNDITPFFTLWNRKITDTIIWPTTHLKLKKYRPFFTIDLNKYKNIVLERFSNS